MKWATEPLNKIATIDRNSISPADIKSGSRYVGLDHIEAGGGSIRFGSVTNGELASNKFQFGPHHILFGKLRPYLAKVVCPDFEGICSTDIIPISPSKRVDKRYLLHFLRRPETISWAAGRATGVNLPRLSPKELASLEIPLPTLDEQRRIAAILDKADMLRRNGRRAEVLIGELSDAIFVSMFGSCRPSALEWPNSKVSEVGTVQLGRQRAPKYQTGKFSKPYVRVANVYEDRIDTSDILRMDFNDRDFRDYKLGYGDILLNEGQSTELVGRPAMWRSEIEDCCFQNTLVRFQADRDQVIPEFALALFLRYYRAGEFAKISSKTSSVAHLGAGRFASMPFPLPPIELQRELATRMIAVNKLKDRYRAEISQTSALFSSVQSRAFSGRL